MRYIFSMIAVFAIGLSILTACNNSANTVAVQPAAKSNSASTATSTKPTAQTDAHGHEDAAPRITLAEAKKDFDAGNAVFVDTRAEIQYQQGRIKGAINIPAEAAAMRYKEIPTGKKIIAYCS